MLSRLKNAKEYLQQVFSRKPTVQSTAPSALPSVTLTETADDTATATATVRESKRSPGKQAQPSSAPQPTPAQSQGIGSRLSGLWTNVKNGFKRAGENITATAVAPINWAVGRVADAVIDKVTSSVQKADVSVVVDQVSSMVNRAADGIAKGVAKGLEEVSDQVRTSAEEVGQKVRASVDEFVTEAHNTGMSMINGFIQKIEKAIISVLLAPLNWFLGLLQSFSDFLGPVKSKRSSTADVLSASGAHAKGNEPSLGPVKLTRSKSEPSFSAAHSTATTGAFFKPKSAHLAALSEDSLASGLSQKAAHSPRSAS